MTSWRRRMDQAKLEALLAETIAIAKASGAVTERQLERVTVDTTVQTKAVAHPTDSPLMLRAIEWLNRIAKTKAPPAPVLPAAGAAQQARGRAADGGRGHARPRRISASCATGSAG